MRGLGGDMTRLGEEETKGTDREWRRTPERTGKVVDLEAENKGIVSQHATQPMPALIFASFTLVSCFFLVGIIKIRV